MPTPKARVHHFQFCDLTPCPSGIKQRHLSIDSTHVKIKKGNAVAISYFWGRDNRDPRTIGHYGKDGKDQVVTLQLGPDWDVPDFTRALHRICNEPAYAYGRQHVWIDQLKTKDRGSKDEVRETLRQIPLIYSSFEVVAPLQGGRCSCWDECLRALELNSESLAEDVQKLLLNNVKEQKDELFGPSKPAKQDQNSETGGHAHSWSTKMVSSLVRQGAQAYVEPLKLVPIIMRTMRELDTLDFEKYASLAPELCEQAATEATAAGISFEAAMDKRRKDVYPMLKILQALKCINNIGFSSWSSRLWTRQELFNAESVCARWISKAGPCPGLAISATGQCTLAQDADCDDVLGRLTLPARLSVQYYMDIVSRTSCGSRLDRKLLLAEALHIMSDRHEMQRQQAAVDVSMGCGLFCFPVDPILFLYGYTIPKFGSLTRIARSVAGPNFRKMFAASEDTHWINYWRLPSKGLLSDLSPLGHLARERVGLASASTKLTAHDFVAILNSLSRSYLTATHGPDYMLAIWTSCPDYQLPSRYQDQHKDEPLSFLLKDGIRKFESKGRMLLTTAPAGLFGAKTRTAHWDPEIYFGHDDNKDSDGSPRINIRSSIDVYGPLFTFKDSFLLCPDQVPLVARHNLSRWIGGIDNEKELFKEPDWHRPRNLTPLCNLLASKTTSDAIRWIGETMQGDKGHWSEATIERLSKYHLQYRFAELNTDFGRLLTYLLELDSRAPAPLHDNTYSDVLKLDAKSIPDWARKDDAKDLKDRPAPSPALFIESDTSKAVSRKVSSLSGPPGPPAFWDELMSKLISVALGFPPELITKCGLQVVVETMHDLNRVGVFSKDFNPQMLPQTVQMTDQKRDNLFYEAITVDGNRTIQRQARLTLREPPAQWRVVGVWVPYSQGSGTGIGGGGCISTIAGPAPEMVDLETTFTFQNNSQDAVII